MTKTYEELMPSEGFMLFCDALEIVHALAEQNALTDEEVGRDEELRRQREIQSVALSVVEDYLVNECGLD